MRITKSKKGKILVQIPENNINFYLNNWEAFKIE